MAFIRGRLSRLALCLATSLAASTAAGQAYQQAAQPAAAPVQPRYPNQPTSFPYAPARPQAQPTQVQPTQVQPTQVQPTQAQPTQMQSQPSAYAQQGSAGGSNYYNNAVPATHAAQPNYGPPAGAAQPAYGAPARPYAANPIRRAGFDQPVDGQAAAAAQSAQPAAQPVSQSTGQPLPAAGQQPNGQQPTVQSGPGAPSSTPPSSVPADVLTPRAANEHVLAPAIRWAREAYVNLDKLEDYSCTLVKRERIDGELGEHEYSFVKVRHRPFSVYMYFLGPAKVKGREALFVAGQNDNKLQAHDNGIRHRMIGTVSLIPTNTIAMTGNKYPITEMGMRRLLERLIEVGDNDMKYGECTVQWIPNAKVDNRVCTCIQVAHPVPRRNFIFHLARIYVDDQLQLPIRYEAYDWPARQGDPPQLTEEYTFLKVKVNNGFTDADFSTENPAYGFK